MYNCSMQISRWFWCNEHENRRGNETRTTIRRFYFRARFIPLIFVSKCNLYNPTPARHAKYYEALSRGRVRENARKEVMSSFGIHSWIQLSTARRKLKKKKQHGYQGQLCFYRLLISGATFIFLALANNNRRPNGNENLLVANSFPVESAGLCRAHCTTRTCHDFLSPSETGAVK